jgi:hypothetical protein
MSAINEVTICNKALDLLGEPPIISLTDDTRAGRLCKKNFDLARDYVTSLHPWRFARKRVVISPMTATPAFGFDNQFQLPSDMLRHFLITTDSNVPLDEYKIEGDVLLSDHNPIYMIYIARLTDALLTRSDPTFAEAISGYLAFVMATPLTQNSQLQQAMSQYAELALRRARGIDSKNDQPQQIHANEFVESRTNGSFDFSVFRFTTP